MFARTKVKIVTAISLLAIILLGCAQAQPTAPATSTAVLDTEAKTVPTAEKAEPAPTEAPQAEPTAPLTGEGEAQEKTLIVGVAGDLEGWDPATLTVFNASELVQNLYDRLVEYDTTMGPDGIEVADISNIKGMLAEDYSVSEDGLTWTFNLRKGIRFSSGHELTSEDVEFSFDRPLEMNRGVVKVLLNLGGVMTTTQTSAPDPYTFQIQLEKPNPLLIHLLTLGSNAVILDSEVVKEYMTGDDPFAEKYLRNHVVGSGPFVLETYEPGNQVVLAANENYWKGPPAVDKLIYRTIPSTQNRIALLLSDAIDVAYDLSPLDLTSTVQGAAGVDVLSLQVPMTTVFFVNAEIEPFDDPTVRKAICYAVPYDVLIEKVLYGLGQPVASPIASGVLYHKSVNDCEHNPNKATVLFEKAGVSDGFDLTLTIRQGIPNEEAAAVILQAELAKYNINVEIEKLPVASYAERRAAKNFMAGIDNYTPYIPDPNYVIQFWYKTGAPLNLWHYSNPQVDELQEQSISELDPQKRHTAIEEIQEILAEEQAAIWLFHPYWNVAMRSDVEGYISYPDRMARYYLMSR